MSLRAEVVVASNRAASGVYEDQTGPLIVTFLQNLGFTVDAPVVVTWSAKRSDEGCTKWTDWAGLGWYHVQAAALGGDPTDVQFELVAPQPGVVTTTADPQQGGKKNRDGDTSHTPGEDGAGNSAG